MIYRSEKILVQFEGKIIWLENWVINLQKLSVKLYDL